MPHCLNPEHPTLMPLVKNYRTGGFINFITQFFQAPPVGTIGVHVPTNTGGYSGVTVQ